MSDNAAPRPDGACLLHAPPLDGISWKRADDGYRTCSGCLDRVREQLADIVVRYAKLDPAPAGGAEQGGRGSPGFGSRAPISVHVVSMMDPRSKSYEVAVDGSVYERWQTCRHPEGSEECACWSRPLPKGVEGPLEPPGFYAARKDVWFAGDGRAHTEQERPPRSVLGVLESIAALLAEEREMVAPAGSVDVVARWLDNQLDWLTRSEMVADVAEELYELHAQLKPVTGDRRRRIGKCPNLLNPGEPTARECGAPLYAPTDLANDDTIRCGRCRRTWTYLEWMRLVDMLEAS